ncbi:Uncharacterized protein Rs2_15745 [Raphanus sativus]|nr:Uncharacterized protein Rs2_15745 [Raphanus sativus]
MAPPSKVAPKQTTPMQDDGFTQVRGARRGTPTLRPVNLVTGEAREVAKRNPRELPNAKETNNIALANKYGSLEMTTNGGESKEDMVTSEGNKENQDMNIQNKKEKSLLQEKEGLIFSGKANAPTSSKGGNQEKWTTNKKRGEGSD